MIDFRYLKIWESTDIQFNNNFKIRVKRVSEVNWKLELSQLETDGSWNNIPYNCCPVVPTGLQWPPPYIPHVTIDIIERELKRIESFSEGYKFNGDEPWCPRAYGHGDIMERVALLSSYDKYRSDTHGEVFTPRPLIEQMFNSLPEEVWSNRSSTFFDPCAGKGNMPAVIVDRLMKGLAKVIPDFNERYEHIVEKQLYMAEYQRRSARDIDTIFNPKKKFRLNLYVGDSLKMPKNFWDLTWKERVRRYPHHYVWDDTPEEHIQYGEITSTPLF